MCTYLKKESDYDCEYTDQKRKHSVDFLLQQIIIIKNKNVIKLMCNVSKSLSMWGPILAMTLEGNEERRTFNTAQCYFQQRERRICLSMYPHRHGDDSVYCLSVVN